MGDIVRNDSSPVTEEIRGTAVGGIIEIEGGREQPIASYSVTIFNTYSHLYQVGDKCSLLLDSIAPPYFTGVITGKFPARDGASFIVEISEER